MTSPTDATEQLPNPGTNFGTSAASGSVSTFLCLPREIRDTIYGFYVATDGGYRYDFEKNKLIRADGGFIELDLMCVCRQIASEMMGMALRENVITFSTHVSAHKAEVHWHRLHWISGWRHRLITKLAPQLLTSEMVESVVKAYPQFKFVLDQWLSREEIRFPDGTHTHCGEAPSVWRDFIDYVFDFIRQQPSFVKEIEAEPSYGWLAASSIEVTLTPNPWSILDDETYEELGHQEKPLDPPGYPISAATVALHFLRILPTSLHIHLRCIVLLEDDECPAYTATHGRGFIPICQANPRLRIERRLNIWTAAVPVDIEELSNYIYAHEYNPEVVGSILEKNLTAHSVTKAVGNWFVETLVLPQLGMPEGSFTLVLDGDPIPHKATEVFSVVQRDAAWQCALDACYASGQLEQPSWLERRLRHGYMYEMLPHAVRMIEQGAGSIRCNFKVNAAHSIEDLIVQHAGWTLEEWEGRWDTHFPRSFQTEAPLPPWHDLKFGHVWYL